MEYYSNKTIFQKQNIVMIKQIIEKLNTYLCIYLIFQSIYVFIKKSQSIRRNQQHTSTYEHVLSFAAPRTAAVFSISSSSNSRTSFKVRVTASESSILSTLFSSALLSSDIVLYLTVSKSIHYSNLKEISQKLKICQRQISGCQCLGKGKINTRTTQNGTKMARKSRDFVWVKFTFITFVPGPDYIPAYISPQKHFLTGKGEIIVLIQSIFSFSYFYYGSSQNNQCCCFFLPLQA